MKSSGFEKPHAPKTTPENDIWNPEATFPDYSVGKGKVGPEATAEADKLANEILESKYEDRHNRNYRPSVAPSEYQSANPPSSGYNHVGRNFATPGPTRDKRQQKRSFRHRLSDWLSKFGL